MRLGSSSAWGDEPCVTFVEESSVVQLVPWLRREESEEAPGEIFAHGSWSRLAASTPLVTAFFWETSSRRGARPLHGSLWRKPWISSESDNGGALRVCVMLPFGGITLGVVAGSRDQWMREDVTGCRGSDQWNGR